MPITATSFQDTNRILYQAPIRRGTGWGSNPNVAAGVADIIDINNNGRLEWGELPSNILQRKFRYLEPALSIDLQLWKETAGQWGQGSVFTESELIQNGVHVGQAGADVGATILQPNRSVLENQKPIWGLARDYFPQGQAAIDVEAETFLIYEPKV